MQIRMRARVVMRGHCMMTSHHGTNTRGHFLEIAWLDDVIVGGGFDTMPSLSAAFDAAQHNERHGADAANFAANTATIVILRKHAEQNQIGIFVR